MKKIDLNSLEYLISLGFRGFKNLSELNKNLDLIHNEIGVYLVLNLSEKKPTLLRKRCRRIF